MSGVFLTLTCCHKEEPENYDNPRIVWTEFIEEEISSYYYDDCYDYQNYLEYHDYPEGTRVVAHYSDNSMTFFGYRWDDQLVCLGNRFGDTQVYELEIPETVIVRRKADSNGWCFDGYSVGEIDTLYVQIIEGGSFDSRITSFTLPRSFFYSDQYRPIESGAFVGCTSLHTITIPSGIETIPAHFFEGVFMRQYEDSYDHEGGPGPSDITITLPEGLITIEDGAFNGCTSLTNVVFPETLLRIDNYAFENCSSLTAISIPNNLSVGYSVFANCTSLRSVALLKTTETISEGAFSRVFATNENSSFSYITLVLSDGIQSVSKNAFQGCSAIESISFPSSIQKVESGAFSGCSSLKTVTIRAGVDSIPDYAYSDVFMKRFESDPSNVTLCLCEGYKTIGRRAFSGCSSFSNIVFPLGLKEISMGAFYGCSSLTELVFPEGFETIQGSYYQGNYGEWEYVIDRGAFSGCSSLTRVVFPESFQGMGESAFSGCSSLKEVVIPSGVGSIPSGAFSYCSSLTNIVLPEGLVVIGGIRSYGNEPYQYNVICDEIPGAFSNCSSLTSIVLPAGLREIGAGVLYECQSLVSCVCYAVEPPRVESITIDNYIDHNDLFNNMYYYDIFTPIQSIYVPRESVDAYKAADGWNHYADIIYPIE